MLLVDDEIYKVIKWFQKQEAIQHTEYDCSVEQKFKCCK